MSTFQDQVPADWEPFLPNDGEGDADDPYEAIPIEYSVNPAGEFPIQGVADDPLS